MRAGGCERCGGVPTAFRFCRRDLRHRQVRLLDTIYVHIMHVILSVCRCVIYYILRVYALHIIYNPTFRRAVEARHAMGPGCPNPKP